MAKTGVSTNSSATLPADRAPHCEQDTTTQITIHRRERDELKRREAEAVRDIAATALYHANRLPFDSEWSEACQRVAEIFGPDGLAAVEAEPSGLPSRSQHHLRVVV